VPVPHFDSTWMLYVSSSKGTRLNTMCARRYYIKHGMTVDEYADIGMTRASAM
jgi:hypothetical protein